VNAASQNEVSKIDLDIDALTKKKDLTKKFQCMVNAMMSHRAMKKLILTGQGMNQNAGRKLCRLSPTKYRKIQRLHNGLKVTRGGSWNKSGKGWTSKGSWKSSHSHKKVAGGHVRTWSSSSSWSSSSGKRGAWKTRSYKRVHRRVHRRVYTRVHRRVIRTKTVRRHFRKHIRVVRRRCVRRHVRVIRRRVRRCIRKRRSSLKIRLHRRYSKLRYRRIRIARRRYLRRLRLSRRRRALRIRRARRRAILRRRASLRRIRLHRRRLRLRLLRRRLRRRRALRRARRWRRARTVRVMRRIRIKTKRGHRFRVRVFRRRYSVIKFHGKSWRCAKRRVRIRGGKTRWIVYKRWRYTFSHGRRYKLIKRRVRGGRWRSYRIRWTHRRFRGRRRRVRVVQRRVIRKHKRRYVTIRRTWTYVRHHKKYRIVKRRVRYTRRWRIYKIRTRFHHSGKWSLKTWGTQTGNFNTIYGYRNIRVARSKYIRKYKYAKYRAYIRWVLTHKGWSTRRKISYIKFYQRFALR
jgi:hypothetical protein